MRAEGSGAARDALRRAGEASVLILISLAGGPKHGYALIQDIRSWPACSSGRAPCTARWTGSSGWA